MEMISTGKRRSSLKGFTLIELVIVLGIMAILVSMLSLAISGFTNNAKRETANEQARMISQSFQTMLTEYEIKGIALDTVMYKNSSNVDTPLFFKPSSTYPTLPETLTIKGDSSKQEIIRTGGTADKGAYEIITKNFEPGFQGAFYISYNSFSYSVNYVVYTDMTYAKSPVSVKNGITYISTYVLMKTNKSEPQLKDREMQKDFLEKEGVVVGCYPYIDDTITT